MKINITRRIIQMGALIFSAATMITSCNKELPDAVPIVVPPPTGQSIGNLISTDTSYSILKAALTKAGLLNGLLDSTALYTVFAPNNDAFRLSGIPSAAVINALPTAQVAAIASYHIIGGQAFTTSLIPTSFPNLQLPTGLVLQAPLFRMSIFPSKRGSAAWANNIPLIATDKQMSNGIIHNPVALISPPSLTIKQIATADTTLSYFLAAVARADSGQTGLGRFDSLLNYPPVNFTVFAPTNQAFRNALVFLGLPPSPAAFNFVPVSTARGIVAYHFMGTRAFSVNFPATPTDLPTLLQLSPTSPPLTVKAQFTGLSFTVLGNGNFGFPSNVVQADIHAINGTVQKIDQVLLPQ